MAEYGFIAPTNDVVQGTDRNGLIEQLRVGSNATAAQMLPGRLVSRDVGDYDVKEGGALLAPEGWIGYASASPDHKPATMDTAYAVGNDLAIHNGCGFRVRASLAKGCSVVKGDQLANWTNGQVIGPMMVVEGGLAVGIPFSASDNSETTTYIELPADLLVTGLIVDVATVDAGETIAVGLLSSEANGDADGFAAGVSVATALKVRPGATVTDDTEVYISASTRGAFLVDTFTAGAATLTDVGTYVEQVYRCDGTAKTVTYTGSAGSDTAAGKIWLVLAAEGLQLVARAVKTADATSGSVNVWSGSLI